MNKLFDMENPFWTSINKIIDLFQLSILWTLCSLPIITMGAASAALYYATVKTVKHERSHSAKEFFRAMKLNFKKGCILQLIVLLLAAAMFASDYPMLLEFLNSRKTVDITYLCIAAGKLFLLLGTSCWLFPLLSRFTESTVKLFCISALQCFRRFLQTLICVFLTAAAILICMEEPLLLAFVPGLTTFLISGIMEPQLQSFYDASAEEQQGEWYTE